MSEACSCWLHLLLKGSAIAILMAVFSATLGVWLLAVALEGFLAGRMLPVPIRLILGIASLLLIIPAGYTELLGLIVMGTVMLYQFSRVKKNIVSSENRSDKYLSPGSKC